MDNFTHTFMGLALSYAGFNRKTRYATFAMVIGANLPDIDLVSRLGGSATYLEYHRGPTHSILGVTILAAALWGLIATSRKHAPPRKTGPPLDRKWLFFACWAATGSHLLLDLTNSYGVRPLWPFSGRWVAWDLEFIVDPLLLALIIAALAVPALLRLISEEVGAQKSSLRRGAIAALCLTAGLWSVRFFAHRRAINMAAALTYQEQNPQRVSAFPSPVNPFEWTGVAETGTAINVFSVDALGDEIDTGDIRTFHKPELSPALNAAMNTRTARIFMAFARYPWADVNETNDGWEITIRDLRFLSAYSHRGGFQVRVGLDKELRVRSQTFSFTGSEPGPES